MERYPKQLPERNQPTEHIEVLRSAHARPDQTFTTSASFIVSPDGVRLLAGRHVTARAASALARNAEAHERGQVVRQFPQRPTSPTGEKAKVAA